MWRSEFREHAIAHFITVVMEVSRRCLAQLVVFEWCLALEEALLLLLLLLLLL
jgi:hypothetical protein